MEAPRQYRPNYEARVGLFALGAIILLIYGWGWLKSSNPFSPPQRIMVQFKDVAGLAFKAPVQVNGVRVGIVEEINLRKKGMVLCTIRINTPELVVPQGSHFTIQTLGLVGAKYVEISLPDLKDGEQPKPIPADMIVHGDDPVRVELYLNQIATNLSGFTGELNSEKARASLRDAIETSGEAMKRINSAAQKLDSNMNELSAATRSIRQTSDRFGTGAASAQNFFNQGTVTMRNIDTLASDLKGSSARINKILDNPQLSGDLRETVKMANQTAQTIQASISQLNAALSDKPLRHDLITIMSKLSNSTENIANAMKVAGTIAHDENLRSDIKQAASDARQAMSQVNEIMNKADFAGDLKSTVARVKSAATNVDTAARQLSSVLNKRSPLLHMIFGKPGKVEDLAPKVEKSTSVKMEKKDEPKTESQPTEKKDSDSSVKIEIEK